MLALFLGVCRQIRLFSMSRVTPCIPHTSTTVVPLELAVMEIVRVTASGVKQTDNTVARTTTPESAQRSASQAQ